MKSYFVDFVCIPMCGTLTAYVEATNEDEAKVALMKQSKILDEDFIIREVVGVYEIDKIPCDCPYIDKDGVFRSAKADQ